jgi:hypothetical protein
MSQFLSILDNIDRLTNIFNREDIIEESKNTFININNNKYSYYYLTKHKFFYINKNNIKLKIEFNLDVNTNYETIYVLSIQILSKKIKCLLLNCRKNFCHMGYHYFDKPNDIYIKLYLQDPDNIIKRLEEKINDFKSCDVCYKIWEMHSNLLNKEYTNCIQCNLTEHLNKKTMKPIEKCSICLKKIYKNTSYKTDCNHIFHYECLNQLISPFSLIFLSSYGDTTLLLNSNVAQDITP